MKGLKGEGATDKKVWQQLTLNDALLMFAVEKTPLVYARTGLIRMNHVMSVST